MPKRISALISTIVEITEVLQTSKSDGSGRDLR